MTKKKLFFDATPLIEAKVSGVGKVLQETLKALDTSSYASKYDMYIFVPFNEALKARKLEYTYIKLKLLPYPHKFFSLFTRMRLAPPIDLFLGKGVYVFENFRNCTLAFSKSITYVHDVAFKMYPEYIQERNLQYLSTYVPLWMDRADAVVAISHSSKVEIERELHLEDVKVVPNAVNQNEYTPRSRSEVDAVRVRWNIPEKYALFIGNIEPRKNLINTIAAFREFNKSTSGEVALVLVGGGGWRNEEIMQEIEVARRSGVRIIRPDGYVPDEDLPALITGASVLLQFSWHEGFGLPVVQALACGTPVAASGTPALREAAQGAIDRVVFAVPSDIEDMARAISEAAKLPREKKARALPSWDDAARALETIIDEL